MSKDKITWFGFKITQKQSVIVFILSLVGICISSMITWSLFYSIFFWILEPYGYQDIDYFIRMLVTMLPYYTFFIVLLILCIYSLIRSRRIAKFHSDRMFNQVHVSNGGMFCPNCGNRRVGTEKFCTKCGEALR